MRHTTLAILATLAAPAIALAQQQQTVFPVDFTSVPGDSVDSRFPFSNGISRMQAIYESWNLEIPDQAQITRVGFRQDQGRASVGQSIQLAIYMGGTSVDNATASSNFANNYQNGTPRTLVFGPAIVALPDFTTTSSGEVWVPLSTPYTHRTAENLVVEYVVTANNNANQAFNYYLDKGTFASPTTRFGTGCPSSAGQTPAVSADAARIDGTLVFRLSRAPASSLVWLNLDFFPFPPLDAGPFGAPGCTLLVAPNIAIAGQGNTGGSATFQFTIPNERSLYHLVVYGQGLIFDLFGNNLGFVMSNGATVELGVNAPMAIVRATGSATASTGSLRRSDGVISLFEWQ